MWIFNSDGFFSVVEYPKDPGMVMVRGRYRRDIEKISKTLGDPAIHTPKRDYPYRVIAAKERWADYLKDSALSIDYGNFKSAVGERQGEEREHVYSEVWYILKTRADDF